MGFGPVDGFLNFWKWRPGGFIWRDEEASQAYSLLYNMRTIANGYAYFIAQHVDGIGGDDIRRGGNPRYVNYFGKPQGTGQGQPYYADLGWDNTTWIAGKDERKWYEQGYVNEGPTAEWAPNMSQLTNAIHQSIESLWSQIAEDASAGEWGAPP